MKLLTRMDTKPREATLTRKLFSCIFTIHKDKNSLSSEENLFMRADPSPCRIYVSRQTSKMLFSVNEFKFVGTYMSQRP